MKQKSTDFQQQVSHLGPKINNKQKTIDLGVIIIKT